MTFHSNINRVEFCVGDACQYQAMIIYERGTYLLMAHCRQVSMFACCYYEYECAYHRVLHMTLNAKLSLKQWTLCKNPYLSPWRQRECSQAFPTATRLVCRRRLRRRPRPIIHSSHCSLSTLNCVGIFSFASVFFWFASHTSQFTIRSLSGIFLRIFFLLLLVDTAIVLA